MRLQIDGRVLRMTVTTAPLAFEDIAILGIVNRI
jgi:hypothetical protein